MKHITLRPASLIHLPAIRQLHGEQNEQHGTSYPLPTFFDRHGLPTPQVPVSLVGIEEGTEEVAQAIWVERRGELMFAGCNPKATAFARRDIEALAAMLTWLGYTGLHCDVPIQLVEHISRPLNAAGFEQNDHRLAHFFRDLREK